MNIKFFKAFKATMRSKGLVFSKRSGSKAIGVLALLAAVFLMPPVGYADELSMPQAGSEADDETFTYVVVERDTLWDISERFFKDPFKWPRIWKHNQHIRNPHLIYPGDVVRITPDGIEIIKRVDKVEVEEPEEKVDVDALPVHELDASPEVVVMLEPPPTPVAAEELPPKHYVSHLPKSGFISDAELKMSGAIIGPKENVMLMQEFDEAFISFKKAKDVVKGGRYTIFKKGERVRHPVTRAKLGYIIEILGDLEVTSVGETIEARINDAYKEIEVGALLKKYKEPATEVALAETESGIDGYVVASLEGSKNSSSKEIVYIDKGESDGLRNGNVMRIYRDRKKAFDPVKKKKVDLPPVALGTLVVIDATDSFSACVILTSVKSIMAGDKVSTASAN